MDANGALLSKRRWQQRLSRPWQRLKKEGCDFLELFLVPSVAVWLPWPTAYRFFRLVIERTPLYSGDIPKCLANARRFLGNFEEAGFVQRQKMLRLLDHVDYWLIRFRPAKAIALVQHEKGNGHWPEKPGSLILSHHWGASILGLLDLSRQGKTPLIVYLKNPLSIRQQGLLKVLNVKMRHRLFHRISGGQALRVLPEGRQMKARHHLMQTKKYPLIMVDRPKNKDAVDCLFLHLGGKKWRYPVNTGFVRLITEHKRSYALFSLSFDYESGRRSLRLIDENLRNPVQLLQQCEDNLNQRLAEDPAQWQFWHVADTLLQAEKENPAP